MNVSQMKNIIVLKDLPSNLVDEAIVILKKGNRVKNKEVAPAKHKSAFEDNVDNNYEIAIKEAELLVGDYIKNLEKPNDNLYKLRKINLQYKKLKLCTLMLGVTALIGIIISIIK